MDGKILKKTLLCQSNKDDGVLGFAKALAKENIRIKAYYSR